MKLLLTSGGITNKKIANALIELVGKKAEEVSIAFVPTAANPDHSDKGWFIDNLSQLKERGYKMIDIVDISALPKEIWLPRFESADVLFFSGGNTTHLIRWMEESGLKEILPQLLTSKVYAGISAGSIVTSPTFALSNPTKKKIYKEKFGYENNIGLGLVNFYIRPHLNSPNYAETREEILKEMAKNIPEPIYALDDHMAIKINGDKMELVGTGKYVVFNK